MGDLRENQEFPNLKLFSLNATKQNIKFKNANVKVLRAV